ncbi:unnamed protein product, partial [Oppiella nova]
QECQDPHEELRLCGTPCPLACKNFTKSGSCLDYCVPNVCQCKHPYVRDESTGKCVVTDDCLIEPIHDCKDPNEQFLRCGTYCPLACSNYTKKDWECIDWCLQDVCQCKHPYVWDESTGRCVVTDDCYVKPITLVYD